MRAYIYDYASVPGETMRWAQGFPLPATPVGKNEVKIRVASVGLNPIDYKIPELPGVSWLRKATPVGVELAGEVVEVGTGVTSVKVGDAVFGGCSKGALAEFAVSKESEIAKLPTSLDAKLAGGYAAVALTALQSLRTGGLALQPDTEAGTEAMRNKRVLILGASGGVGHVAVQMAKRISGCGFVCGVCSGGNAEFVKKMGADAVLDYTAPNFRLCGEAAGEEERYDLVLDAVSNPKFSYEDEARRCLKTGGTGGEYVAINTRNFSDWPRAMAAQVTGWSFWQRRKFKLVMCQFQAADVKQIGNWLADGKLGVQVAKTTPFTEAGVKEGFAQLKTERTVGKVVVQME